MFTHVSQQDAVPSGGAYQPAAGGDDSGAAGADLAAVGGFGPPDRPIAYRCPFCPIPPAAVATPSLAPSINSAS